MACVDRPLYRVTERRSGAMATVPRDPMRLCRNKLALLSARKAVDAEAGGGLAPLYAGSLVLGALEMLASAVRRLPRLDAMRLLHAYLRDRAVRSALRKFPLSVRRPLVAAAVLSLRVFA